MIDLKFNASLITHLNETKHTSIWFVCFIW